MASLVGNLETQLMTALAALTQAPEIYKRTALGLDDFTVSGTSTATGPIRKDIQIVTGGATSPNTLKHRTDGGAWSAPVDMTGAAQSLGNGFSGRFAAIVGHTAGDTYGLQNGPLREITTGAFDGTAESVLELVADYQSRVPIGVLGLCSVQYSKTTTVARRLTGAFSWVFAVVSDPRAGSGSDQQAERRTFYNAVVDLFGAAVVDLKLSTITTPIRWEFESILGGGVRAYNNVGEQKLFVSLHDFSVSGWSRCGEMQ